MRVDEKIAIVDVNQAANPFVWPYDEFCMALEREAT